MIEVAQSNVSYEVHGEVKKKTAASSFLFRLHYLAIILSLFVIPLAFGGVHEQIFLSFSIFVLLVAIFTIAFNRQASIDLSSAKNAYPSSHIVFSCLIAFLLFGLLQYIVLSVGSQPHPSLGMSASLHDQQKLLAGWVKFTLFLSVFFVARMFFREQRYTQTTLALVGISGFIVALIGILHWFSDNGMLFWTFAPESSFVSERARWPFVNPNHLGNFLLLVAFLGASRCSEHYFNLKEFFFEGLSRKGAKITEVLGQRRTQQAITRLVLSLVSLFLIIMTISATLSRGTWAGACFGLLVFVLICFYKIPSRHRHMSQLSIQDEDLENGEVVVVRVKKKRRRSARSDIMRTLAFISNSIIKYAIPVVLVIGLYVFLRGRGAELIEGRIEYGLLYSKSDIRWQMYADTLSLVKDHLWFGVGPGNWEDNYSKYMHQSLSGINPEYLHSDPLQMLAEFGILGSGLILIIAAYLCIQVVHCFSRLSNQQLKIQIAGLFCGLLASIAGSFVDFPYRIPAIFVLFAIELALLCSLLDESKVASRALE